MASWWRNDLLFVTISFAPRGSRRQHGRPVVVFPSRYLILLPPTYPRARTAAAPASRVVQAVIPGCHPVRASRSIYSRSLVDGSEHSFQWTYSDTGEFAPPGGGGAARKIGSSPPGRGGRLGLTLAWPMPGTRCLPGDVSAPYRSRVDHSRYGKAPTRHDHVGGALPEGLLAGALVGLSRTARSVSFSVRAAPFPFVVRRPRIFARGHFTRRPCVFSPRIGSSVPMTVPAVF